ncbi:hypothetical protein AVEN_204394-1 [Araneus ventricosus]|uniref:Cyclic nucleotide phosphodiesterase catalytic domain-containing protein n=1 Tax=Araneus ventricosus TaxID=182803 RepID=A0A4Y2RVA8_ARAVE|nr:hypothetical protein AVEN_204394-1 [Araneus ventricosus]
MASKIDAVTEKLEQSKISSGEDKAPVEYFPLKMVKDKKTEMYVKFAKVMVVVQGPCTDIRKENSEMIETTFKYTSCIVSDKKFSKDTRTSCSYENAEEFYEYFKGTARQALEEGNNLLVIDSTMSNIEQNKYYVALAYKMQYVVLVVPPVVMKTSRYFWPKGSLAASFRNEGKTVIQPTNMFQHLFCAWYLHDIDSHELRHDASLYIQDCLEEIPEFKKLMDKNCLKTGPDDEKLSLIDAVRQYYCLTDKRQDLAFCAVKILGNSMRLMNEYFKKQSVQDTYGKMSKLYIAGYIISPHMIAARVKLTHAQKDLWEIEEDIDESTLEDSEEKCIGPWKLLEDSKKELPDVKVQLISSKSNQTLINTGRTVHEPLESIHHFAKGRACHIVLGKAAGASPHHVDFGVQFALNRERRAVKAKATLPVYELERCVVKRNGKYWFIYLRENMCIDGLFASCVKPYPFDYSIVC